MRFKAVVDARYADVKVRTAQEWERLDGAMRGAVEQFPLPADIMVVD
jgi:hypothetical protein